VAGPELEADERLPRRHQQQQPGEVADGSGAAGPACGIGRKGTRGKAPPPMPEPFGPDLPAVAGVLGIIGKVRA
jgi:hypothetical protein